MTLWNPDAPHGPSTFTVHEVEQILRNMGHDMECGECVSVAFTGSGSGHAHTCKTGSPITLLDGVIVELEELMAKATPRPWEMSKDRPDDVVIWGPDDSNEPDGKFLLNVGHDRHSQMGVGFDVDQANAELIVAAVNGLPILLDGIRDLKAARDQLAVQLAGCGVAALGGTADPAKPGDYSYSTPYGDVLALRLRYDAVVEAHEEGLARLYAPGFGPHDPTEWPVFLEEARKVDDEHRAHLQERITALEREALEALEKVGLLMQPIPEMPPGQERFPWEMMRLWCVNRDTEKRAARVELGQRDARIATLEAALNVERNDVWHDPWCVFLEGEPPRKQVCNCSSAERIARIDQALAAQDGRGGKDVADVAATWVPVTDGLPEMGEYVLVFPDRRIGVRVETWNEHTGEPDGGWHWETDGEGFEIDRVTHWARIQAPLKATIEQKEV